MRHTLLRDAIRGVLGAPAGHGKASGTAGRMTALAALGLIGVPAFAQDAQDQADNQQLETITVTGSNIRRVDIETSNPVITIDRAAIQKTGKLTLGDLVQQLPAVTGPNINPQINNGGGTGASSIGLRGLGSPRTLVLINGHRYLIGDPNAIPANMIERIEVLTDGASSVYGSDAVAGVVNFILRSDYQGAEFSASYGISDKDDAEQRGYQFTFGQSTDKGSIMAGISYNKTGQVLAGHRDFSKNSVSLYGNTSNAPAPSIGGSTSSPFGHVQIPDEFADLFPTCTTGFLARNPGASGLNIATDYHCYVNNGSAAAPSDKYNFATVNLIMTPQERTGLFLNGNYKLTDNIEVYADVLHNKTSSAFQLAPAVYGTPFGAIISADSYYNPFGVDFIKDTGLTFTSRLASLGNRRGAFGTNTDQIHTGFRGSFGVWNDQQWNWEVGYDYGHVSLLTTTYGLPNMTIVNQETGPSFYNTDPDVGPINTVLCGTPEDVIGSCTPINIFNLDDPATIAALQAAGAPASSSTFSQEKVWRADLNGGLFELPAGTMQLAVGAAYRKEYTHTNVDTSLRINPDTGNCVLGSQCGSPLQGGYNVKEVYAELFVPILKDLPFVHALNLTIGDRYSKYNNFGNTNNSKIALEWRPIEDLLLRGTVSEVFRAPTVANIFGAPINDAPKLSHDPCDGYTGGDNPACVNVPTDGSFRNQNVAQQLQITAIASGSEYAGFPLGPELGKSFDFGIVYDPHFIEGLSVSADIWRLYLNNIITNVGAQSVIDLCAAGQLVYCTMFTRVASGPNQGQISRIQEPTGNLGRVDVKGVDFSLNYRLPEFSFGRFNVQFNATYLTKYDVSTAPGTPANTVYHYAGHFLTFGSSQAAACATGVGSGGVCLYPRWRAQSAVNWQLGNFDASWRMRYIGRFRMGSPAPTQDVFPAGTCYYGDYCTLHGLFYDFGATVYNDVQFGYNLESWNTRFDVGVNNVADKQPPLLYANNTNNANTDPANFDLLGRYYFARVTVKF